jgi:hypothetical protein
MKRSERDLEFAEERIRTVAKQLLAGEIGVIVAARELASFWQKVGPELSEALVIFVGIDSETDALPVGEVRRHWNPDALSVEDQKIAAAEQVYRSEALVACTRLLHILGHEPA